MLFFSFLVFSPRETDSKYSQWVKVFVYGIRCWIEWSTYSIQTMINTPIINNLIFSNYFIVDSLLRREKKLIELNWSQTITIEPCPISISKCFAFKKIFSFFSGIRYSGTLSFDTLLNAKNQFSIKFDYSVGQRQAKWREKMCWNCTQFNWIQLKIWNYNIVHELLMNYLWEKQFFAIFFFFILASSFHRIFSTTIFFYFYKRKRKNGSLSANSNCN